MSTLFFIPYLVLSSDTVGTLDSLLLDISAVKASPQRLLLVIPTDTPDEVIDECVEVCATASETIGIELVLSKKSPRTQMARLSSIRQIVHIYIPDDGYYQPVERGERNHLLDSLPSFFAYGYEVGIATETNLASSVIPILGHIHTIVSKNVVGLPDFTRQIHSSFPTTTIGVMLTKEEVNDGVVMPLVEAGVSLMYVPLSLVSFDWDTCNLHSSLSLPVSVIPTIE